MKENPIIANTNQKSIVTHKSIKLFFGVSYAKEGMLK